MRIVSLGLVVTVLFNLTPLMPVSPVSKEKINEAHEFSVTALQEPSTTGRTLLRTQRLIGRLFSSAVSSPISTRTFLNSFSRRTSRTERRPTAPPLSAEDRYWEKIAKQHFKRQDPHRIANRLATAASWLGPRSILSDQFKLTSDQTHNITRLILEKSLVLFEYQGFSTALHGTFMTRPIDWEGGDTIDVRIFVAQRRLRWQYGQPAEALTIRTTYSREGRELHSDNEEISRPLRIGNYFKLTLPPLREFDDPLPFLGASRYRHLEQLPSSVRKGVRRILYVASGDDTRTASSTASSLPNVEEVVMEDIGNGELKRMTETSGYRIPSNIVYIKRSQDALAIAGDETLFDLVIVKGPGQESFLLLHPKFWAHVESRLKPGGVLAFFSMQTPQDNFKEVFGSTGYEPGIFYYSPPGINRSTRQTHSHMESAA